MELIEILLLLSTLLCSLVAGLVLTFAIVVMPGIAGLGRLGYLRSFKAIDGVIQDGQPIFGLVWVGSALVLITSAVLGFGRFDGLNRMLLTGACVIYLLGVQLPTITINIPLNNRLKSLNLDTASEQTVSEVAKAFESRWMRWNTIRTILATLTTLLLLLLLVRL